MSAMPDLRLATPVSVEGYAMARPVYAVDRRVVAVAVDAVELLRPGSDLARQLASFGRADVLLVAEVRPGGPDDNEGDDDEGDEDEAEAGEADDELLAGAAALRHPDLAVHRLALRLPLTLAVEDDLVAALSELVGFDPEPGVYCLAPAAPRDGVLRRAAQRIARVYGVPLLRYRCLELSLVKADTELVSSPSPRRAAQG